MKLNLIVCVDENYGIGYENQLLFNIKQDMEFFKEKTTGNVIVMGSNTLKSLPNSSPLKNRVNIVMTSKNNFEGCICCKDIDELFLTLQKYQNKEIFVIGGEQIYKMLLPYCQKAFITKVSDIKKADTFFPNIDKFPNWKIVAESPVLCQENASYRYCIYKNIDTLPYKN